MFNSQMPTCWPPLNDFGSLYMHIRLSRFLSAYMISKLKTQRYKCLERIGHKYLNNFQPSK